MHSAKAKTRQDPAAEILYCIVSIHLYSASCSLHQPEALPVRETQREESSRPTYRDIQPVASPEVRAWGKASGAQPRSRILGYITSELLQIFNKRRTYQKTGKSRQSSHFIHVKVKDIRIPQNYRQISLTLIPRKIFTKLIQNRLTQ